MYTKVTNCRACGFGQSTLAPGTKTSGKSDSLQKVFSLGIQPLANDFVELGGEHQGFAPIDVLFCPRCSLAQLSVVVKPEILYSHNYAYVTSKSQMMQEHFERIWSDVNAMAKTKTVLEIGSNDGHFLDYCRTHGADSVMGIEPAENLVKHSRDKGIPTLCDFFSESSADMVLNSTPKVGMIFARHVFCHIDNWIGFMKAIQVVADEDTVIFIEAPYVLDQIASNSFDQIYHEHLSYLSVRAIVALLNHGPFQLQGIYHYLIHGGAMGLIIQRRKADRKPDCTVEAYLSNEQSLGPDTWKAFDSRCRDLITELKLYVAGLVQQGKRVVGFGASAKSSVWINACGFNRTHIQAVYDCTPEKWYRTIPGTDIPVVNEGAFYADAADYAVMFAWNFQSEVLENHEKWMKGGGKFIIPVPRLRVIGIDSDTGGA